MNPYIPIAASLLLSLTGCVAAVPVASQLASNPDTLAKLCSFAKMPGQTASVCDHMPFAPAAQTPGKSVVTANTSVH